MSDKNVEILIVEDESILALQLESMLDELHYQTVHILDKGDDALKYMKTKHADLILMDIRLKGKMDGIEAAEKIQKIKDIPIIFITAYADNETIDRAKAIEPYGYLIKPFKLEELKSTIEIAFYKHQAQQLLKKREKRYYNLFEQSNDAIIIFRYDGMILNVNQMACEFLGLSKEKLINSNVIQIHPENERKTIKKSISTIQKKGHVRIESCFQKNDGTLLYVDISASVVDSDEGIIQEIARDISQRKINEEELKKLTAAIEQSPAHIMITDKMGNIEYVNPKFTEVTGYTFNEVVGKNPKILKSGKLSTDVYKSMWKAILSKKTWRGEFANIKKNGELFWEEAIVGPILNDEGDITHFIGIKVDVTHQKRIEEEKRKLEVELKRSSRLETIGTLAGGIAHDFNNILTPMAVYADMALDDVPENSQTQSDINHVIKGIQRAKNLVQQILTFSRQHEQDFKPLLLHLIIKEVLHLIRASIPSTISIQEDIDSNCGPVLADATQIHQVIMNLCANAKQAMPSGGLLEVVLEQVDIDIKERQDFQYLEEGRYAKLSIRDTGSGMDPGMVDHIFDPFYSTKEPGEGTGLGLSVVHGIVKSHHGEIVVKSRANSGSKFEIYLPICDQAIEKDKPINHKLKKKRRGNILFVDDEEENRNMGKDMLSRAGFDVTVAGTGSKTIQLIKQNPNVFDVAIFDLIMPEMTGFELAKEVHKINKKLPIILLTGYGDDLDEYLPDRSEFKCFLHKPPDRKALCDAIDSLIKT